MKFGIIGAGMAGLACADELVEQGHEVALFDKGRGPGGRMSTRRVETPLGQAAFDHGAQYFTARDPGFCSLVSDWQLTGVAMLWPVAGTDAFVGVPGMNAPIKAMAENHHVSWGCTIKGIVRNNMGWHLMDESGSQGPFDAVVIAIPAEQAAPILSLHDFAMARLALMARAQPCWTGLYVFAEPLVAPMPVLRDTGPIGWATCNSAKPGRSGPVSWVVQACAAWSKDNLERPADEIAADMLTALGEALGTLLPTPAYAHAHRWRYALSAGTGDGALWNPDIGLGVCGDWLLGPRVECAWLSGRALGHRAAKEPVKAWIKPEPLHMVH